MLRSIVGFPLLRLADGDAAPAVPIAPIPIVPAGENKMLIALRLLPLGFLLLSMLQKSDVLFVLKARMYVLQLAAARLAAPLLTKAMLQKLFFNSVPVIVPHVRLSGMIASGAGAGRLNVQSTKAILEKTFAKLDAAPTNRELFPCVAITINSPGGSPTQSMMILDQIRRLQKKYHNVPVLTYCEDV